MKRAAGFGGMFHVYVGCRFPMHWTYAKRQLAGFATVHQDGDDEGTLLLMRMMLQSVSAIAPERAGGPLAV